MANPVDEPRELQPILTAFHYGGLLLRAIGYLAVFAIAQRYDFGQALLTGILIGDIAGQCIQAVLHWRSEPLAQSCQLLFLALVYLGLRSMLTWPPEPALRAIAFLAAFGAFSGHVGSSMLLRLGPSPA